MIGKASAQKTTTKIIYTLSSHFAVILLLTGVTVLDVNAQTLTEQQFADNLARFDPLKNQVLEFQRAAEFEQTLQRYNEQDRAMISHLWLTTLSSEQHVNNAHMNWIEQQTASQQTVLVSLSDHPDHAIALINIQENAEATLKLLRIQQLALTFAQQWAQNTTQWQTWLNKDTEHYVAFIRWLKAQSRETHGAIIQNIHLNAAWTLLPDNQVYTILLQTHPSEHLAARLLRQPTDEYTYQFLQGVSATMERYEAINTLGLAMLTPELSSQSIYLLAQHYSDDPIAQSMIERAFDSPQQQWFAVAVIDKVPDPRFRQKLNQRFAKQPTQFAKTVMQQLAKAEQ